MTAMKAISNSLFSSPHFVVIVRHLVSRGTLHYQGLSSEPRSYSLARNTRTQLKNLGCSSSRELFDESLVPLMEPHLYIAATLLSLNAFHIIKCVLGVVLAFTGYEKVGARHSSASLRPDQRRRKSRRRKFFTLSTSAVFRVKSS